MSTVQKNGAIEYLSEMIDRITGLIRAADELPELPAYCRLWATSTELRVRMPYNRDWFQKVQAILERAGYIHNADQNWHSDEGNGYCNFYKDDIRILVTLMSTEPGSVCVVEKVDERIIPVYRVVCE